MLRSWPLLKGRTQDGIIQERGRRGSSKGVLCMRSYLILLVLGLSQCASATVKYFAYGSNCFAETLRLRTGVASNELLGPRPKPAMLRGYRLSFSLPGIPLVEPSFATVVPSPRDLVWGCLYELPSDGLWRRLCLTEGVPLVYEALPCSVVTADGDEIGGCFTLYAPPRCCFPLGLEVAPSQRYLATIVAGLRESGVRAEYLDYIDKRWGSSSTVQ